MGLRYDLVYTTKELSRTLAEPTKTSNEILNRALTYATRTKHAKLVYDHEEMITFKPPATRKKPGDGTENTYQLVKDYNLPDAMPHQDDIPTTQDFLYDGPVAIVTCETDIDLAGQVESRQPTSGYVLKLNGVPTHWRASTEKVITLSTAAGEYIALSRGNTACKFVSSILHFMGNPERPPYFLYSDNQAANI